MMCSRLHEKFL
jgi:hypothetical protein